MNSLLNMIKRMRNVFLAGAVALGALLMSSCNDAAYGGVYGYSYGRGYDRYDRHDRHDRDWNRYDRHDRDRYGHGRDWDRDKRWDRDRNRDWDRDRWDRDRHWDRH